MEHFPQNPDSKLPSLPTRAFWKRYYYEYLSGFTSFLVPKNAKTFFFGSNDFIEKQELTLPSLPVDYVVLSDVMGYIYDVEASLSSVRSILKDDGRLIVTQYSMLWEPLLRLATRLHLRRFVSEQNWLSLFDLKNFMHLSGFEVVKSGTKMLLPVYIPIISVFFNKVLANIWPFSVFGLFNYVVVRKSSIPAYQKKPSLSIIVPARNESGTIEKIVHELPEVGFFTEIIFIEGNSTDNTAEEIKRVVQKFGGTKKLLFAKQEGRGKGDAVRKGFDMATGDILAIYDADMTVPPEDVTKFYNAIVQNKADFINGSRLVYPMQKESMRILNFFGNKFFSFAFSWILGQQIKDTLCGTKVLWKKDYENIKSNRAFFGEFDPFGDFDLLFGAAKQNRKIIDLPVRYRERTYGTTNISRFSHGWLLLKMVFFALRKIKFI